MAPTAHGGPGPQNPDAFANGAPSHGPPPSTLAAQLVENISASTRSSRPDETAELKKLFSVIEKVKNQPELLNTPEQRVEHNHMLIYVYARVVLEGLRWDDIFADKAQLREEALRALSFLKITISETPEVLLVSSPGTFIFRGREPLWLWVLPKVLKMLGHSQCLALTSTIEDLLQKIFLIICQAGSLWRLAPAFLQYIQANFGGTYRIVHPVLCHRLTPVKPYPNIAPSLRPRVRAETALPPYSSLLTRFWNQLPTMTLLLFASNAPISCLPFRMHYATRVVCS